MHAREMEEWNNSYVTYQPNMRANTEAYRNKYYPDDAEASLWMYAMICVGSAFVLFVLVTLYLMCHSAIRQVGAEDRYKGTLAPSTGYRVYHNDA